TGAARFDEF
nr:Chain P, Transcription initiation factor IIB [Mus musculus]